MLWKPKPQPKAAIPNFLPARSDNYLQKETLVHIGAKPAAGLGGTLIV
jgi:hypothetical protein